MLLNFQITTYTTTTSHFQTPFPKEPLQTSKSGHRTECPPPQQAPPTKASPPPASQKKIRTSIIRSRIKAIRRRDIRRI